MQASIMPSPSGPTLRVGRARSRHVPAEPRLRRPEEGTREAAQNPAGALDVALFGLGRLDKAAGPAR
jgi:hypothetical protein